MHLSFPKTTFLYSFNLIAPPLLLCLSLLRFSFILVSSFFTILAPSKSILTLLLLLFIIGFMPAFSLGFIPAPSSSSIIVSPFFTVFITLPVLAPSKPILFRITLLILIVSAPAFSLGFIPASSLGFIPASSSSSISIYSWLCCPSWRQSSYFIGSHSLLSHTSLLHSSPIFIFVLEYSSAFFSFSTIIFAILLICVCIETILAISLGFLL